MASGRDDGVGVDAHEQFRVANVLDAVVEGLGLAGVRLAEDENFSRGGLGREGLARDFERAVLRAVVNDNDAQIRIVRVQRGPHRSLDNFLFVVGRDQHRDFRLVGGDFCGLAENLLAHAVIHGRRANKEQSARHQQVADQENPGDNDDAGIE